MLELFSSYNEPRPVVSLEADFLYAMVHGNYSLSLRTICVYCTSLVNM